MENGFYRIGELARRTGLTVRTLHHYDRIGLLKPVRDSRSGHRYYGVRELARLQRILGLRQLGLSLADIAEALDRPNSALPRVLALQAEALERRMRETDRMLKLLSSCRAQLNRGESLAAEQLLDIIGMTTMHEKYFSDAQLETLKHHRADIGEAAVREAEREWPELIAAMRREMEAGTDPAEPKVAALARRWRELVKAFSGGDAGIEASVGRMYADEPGLATAHNLDRELFAYAGRAMAALEEK